MMKNIITIVSLMLFFSCNSSNNSTFNLEPSKPVEIGVESIDKDDAGVETMKIYMINHQPVSGVQFEIEPKGFFEVDSVFGGRSEKNNFQLHHNKAGKILGFSMTGKSIPESINSKKEDNILFLVTGRFLKPLDLPVVISPIIASSSAKKIDCLSMPFELIGK